MRKRQNAAQRRWTAYLVAGSFSLTLLAACRGEHEGPGKITESRVPEAAIAGRVQQQAAAVQALVPNLQPKQILFGDLHVHTTFSADAFMRSLPMLQGEGAHPPADACDFARFCSGLDFWSITDHAEAITPLHWKETKDLIRQCNAIAGDPKNPDVVAFLGWEWTQVGITPQDHYGHKNVIFKDLDDDKVPTRPISALNEQLIGALRNPAPLWQRLRFPILDWSNRQRYYDLGKFQQENREIPLCDKGVDVHKLSSNCHEAAHTPEELFEKLSQWGFDTMVIPHGTTWGFYTPAGSTMDKQLKGAQHDPSKQYLFEIFSGHGNSEEYRDWRPIKYDEKGIEVCPPPTKDYLPCCWRAGEIIRSRCGNIPKEQCDKRVEQAQLNYMMAGIAGHLTVPGAKMEDWLDCGQCRDCFTPSFNFRPTTSAQYTLAISNFDDPAKPRRFRYGFIASSDNHTARPGTGYKEFARHFMTEAAGARDEAWHERMMPPVTDPSGESQQFDLLKSSLSPFQIAEFERQASYFVTGGLVAVHAAGRGRDAIWSALKQREVYGTSGARILLWFDLLNAPHGSIPMGSETTLNDAPHFRVRAIGAFKQKPGCPDVSTKALGPERLKHLCRNECFNPSDERHHILQVDVIRIRPQEKPGEPLRSLIEDPWKRVECAPSEDGCEVEFDDPEFTAGNREVVYYVRALQEPTLAVNAGGLRCKFNQQGECIEVHPCYGDFRLPYEEDCLTSTQERAWSSPIYVRPGA